MKKLVTPKIISIMLMVTLILLLVWMLAPLLEINDINLFESISARIILSLSLLFFAGLALLTEKIISMQLKQRQDALNELQLARTENKKLFNQQQSKVILQLKALLPVWCKQAWQRCCRLPFYLIIGEQQSGKTTLLASMGANFSSQSTTVFAGKNVEYSLRFSKEATFIDVQVAPTENSQWGCHLDDPVWTGIAKFIAWRRWFKPINGIMVTISLTDLLLQKNNQQLQHLSSSLEAIKQQLGYKVPVYFAFTKCDLLVGFTEFFNKLNKDELQQILGINFPQKITREAKSCEQFFSDEFDKIINIFNANLLSQLAIEKDSAHRKALFCFPQQLQLFKSVIMKYLNALPDVPIRGIYFFSCKQGDIRNDFMLADISTIFNISLPVAQPCTFQDRHYFVEKFYPNVLAADANIKPKKPLYVLYITASLLIFLSMLGLFASNRRNENNLNQINNYLPELSKANNNLMTTSGDILQLLPSMKTMQNITQVYTQDKQKFLLNFEIVAPLAIKNSLNSTQRNFIKQLFLPKIAQQLETILINPKINSELLYLALKGYMVFTGHNQAKPAWIIPPIILALALNNKSDEAILRAFLKQGVKYEIPSIKENQQLIAAVRAKLQNLPPAEFAYYELKQSAEVNAKALDIISSSGDSFQRIFTFGNGLYKVPTLFTYKWFKHFYAKKSTEVISEAADIYWILGLDKPSSKSSLAAQITPQLWKRYDLDYSFYWQQYLANLQIIAFKDLPVAVNTLNLLLGAQSPLEQLLHLVQVNTLHIKGENLTVADNFAALNALTLAKNNQPTQYLLIVKKLTAVRDYLLAINNAPNSLQAQFDAAKAYMQGADNPIRQLKLLALQMPVPVNNWLDAIANHSLELLLVGAKRVINNAWQINVLPVYQQQLSGRFPLEKKAETIISLASFGEFFGNGGIAPQFIQNYIQPFVDVSKIPWSAYSIGGSSIGLCANSLKQLENMMQLKNIYFAPGAKLPSVQFNVTPKYLDTAASSVNVQFAQQTLLYRHGPLQPISIHWSVSSEEQQASYTITDFSDRSYSRTFNGPWAWLKLLSESSLQTIGNSGRYTWKLTNNKHQAIFEIWSANNKSFFNLKVMHDLKLPSELL